MGSLIVLLISVILAGPVAQAPADGPYLVELEISHEVGESYFYDPAASAFGVEVPVDTPVTFRLSVFDPARPDQPVDVEDTSWLLEIRKEDAPAVRFSNMERVAPGVYETAYVFHLAGRWLAVVQPDIEDRPALPEGSSDQVTIWVETEPIGISAGPRPLALVASFVLVVLVGALVVLAGRSSGKAPGEPGKQPVTHDTWWNSP